LIVNFCLYSRYLNLIKASLFLLLISFSQQNVFGAYVLERGKGTEVCEEYGKAINAERVVKGLGYSRPMPKSFTQFGKPKWQEASSEIYSSEHLSKVWRFWFDRDANPANYIYLAKPSDWKATPQQIEKAWLSYVQNQEIQGTNQLYYSRFDIDNDGKNELILLNKLNHALFAVMDDDHKDVNAALTEKVYGHLSHKEFGLGEYQLVKSNYWGVRINGKQIKKNGRYLKQVPSALNSAIYDFFFYKGKTYIDLAWGDHPSYDGLPPWKAGKLKVFVSEGGKKSRVVCDYKIVSSQ